VLTYTKTKLIDEGGVKEVFDHIRNLLMATIIIAAGSYGLRQSAAIDVFGVLDVELAGYGVMIIGVVLAVLNALNGLHQLSKQQWHTGFRIAAIVLYFFGTMRLLQFIVILRYS
jgi:hypothetical protein